MDKKVALVVGGTSGIGLAAAVMFRKRGYDTVISGRNTALGQANAEAHDLDFIASDVRQAETIETLVAGLVAKYGRLDCAFNNAGWEGPAKPTADIAETDWQKMIDLKLSGTWRCMAAELTQMRTQAEQPCSIVNMAGNWGLVGAANFFRILCGSTWHYGFN